jgi:hypothetical protein
MCIDTRLTVDTEVKAYLGRSHGGVIVDTLYFGLPTTNDDLITDLDGLLYRIELQHVAILLRDRVKRETSNALLEVARFLLCVLRRVLARIIDAPFTLNRLYSIAAYFSTGCISIVSFGSLINEVRQVASAYRLIRAMFFWGLPRC